MDGFPSSSRIYQSFYLCFPFHSLRITSPFAHKKPTEHSTVTVPMHDHDCSLSQLQNKAVNKESNFISEALKLMLACAVSLTRGLSPAVWFV